MTEIPKLAADVQLASLLGGGQLNWCWTEMSAAVLIELTLLGRIGSTPETGLFARESVRKFVVLDRTPTQQPVLDYVLARIVDRGKPWEIYACLRKLAT